MKKEALPTPSKGAQFDARQTRSVEERGDAKSQYEHFKVVLMNATHWGDCSYKTGNGVGLPADEGDLIK